MSKTFPAVIELARELIRRESITPHDAGCQDLLVEQLEPLGFDCQRMPFGEVSNLWARHGTAGPLFVFAGHTDVVPPGAVSNWRYPPFAAEVADGYLWGRGAADMKGGLAAMTCALQEFVSAVPEHDGSVALLVTSAEETSSPDGTKRVMQELVARGQTPTWSIIGEPSSVERVGDQARHGRRGSITFRLRVGGVQGHVAYPQAADNPIHRLVSILAELQRREWDAGDRDFSASCFQVVSMTAGVGAENVIPPEAAAVANFRYGPAQSAEALRKSVAEVVAAYSDCCEIEVHDAGRPFVTRSGHLLEATAEAVETHTGSRPVFSTSGGTSDGRFIAPAGVEVVELGPTNSTIHAVNERIGLDELPQLVAMYSSILRKLLV